MTLATVVGAMAKANFIKSDQKTVGTMIEWAEARKFDGEPKHPEFYEALLELANERGRLRALSLGRWLNQHKGRVVGGYRLEGQFDKKRKQFTWWVEKWQKTAI